MGVHTIDDAKTAPKVVMRVVCPASCAAGQAMLQCQFSSQQRACIHAHPVTGAQSATDVTTCNKHRRNKEQAQNLTRLLPLTVCALSARST